MKELNLSVQEVVSNTLIRLELQGYNVHSEQHYKVYYRRLMQFCNDNSERGYSREIGERFINELQIAKHPPGKEQLRSYVNAVEHLNRTIEKNHDWPPSNNRRNYKDSIFNSQVKTYDEHLRNRGNTESNIRAQVHIIANFLYYADCAGIRNLTELTAQHVYEMYKEANDKNGFRRCMSAFLRYAYRNKLIAQDLSLALPSAIRKAPVPTVYTPEEIEKIINATVAQSENCSLRNKSMVLLAVRLGLRSSDIINLRFENVDFYRGAIKLIQQKNKQVLTLPLLSEISEALNEYIENERPDSESNYIFLRHRPPTNKSLQSHALYNIVSRAIAFSGIDAGGRRRGGHALRSSLATALLNEGYNHSDVQQALGQKSPDAVKSYIKTDIKHLYDYALPVPAPFGKFAANLGLGGTV